MDGITPKEIVLHVGDLPNQLDPLDGSDGEMSDEDEGGVWGVMSRGQREELQGQIANVMVAGEPQKKMMEIFCPGRFRDEAPRAGYESVLAAAAHGGECLGD